MHMRPPVILLILSLIPAIGMAEVFSWKDASGKIHYGDRPPATLQKDSRKLAAPPPPTADVAAAQQAAIERKMSNREKQQKDQEAAKKTEAEQAEAQQRAENCRQAKSSLAAIESGQVRFTIDAKGERTGLDGAARDAELAKARKLVDDWCRPQPPTR